MQPHVHSFSTAGRTDMLNAAYSFANFGLLLAVVTYGMITFAMYLKNKDLLMHGGEWQQMTTSSPPRTPFAQSESGIRCNVMTKKPTNLPLLKYMLEYASF
jgi:hypothetical protein